MELAGLFLFSSALFIAAASPGPGIAAIVARVLGRGPREAIPFSIGIALGDVVWLTFAVLGLAALAQAFHGVFLAVKYAGAAYLLYLALRSARQALWPTAARSEAVEALSPGQAYRRGVALHLTNPKAILFFGSLYALGVSPGTPWSSLAVVIAAVGLQSAIVFHGYALLFSSGRIAGLYARLRRWFEAAFALAFGAASLKVLTARLQ